VDSLWAAGHLGEAVASDNWERVEELLGATDCGYGCPFSHSRSRRDGKVPGSPRRSSRWVRPAFPDGT